MFNKENLELLGIPRKYWKLIIIISLIIGAILFFMKNIYFIKDIKESFTENVGYFRNTNKLEVIILPFNQISENTGQDIAYIVTKRLKSLQNEDIRIKYLDHYKIDKNFDDNKALLLLKRKNCDIIIYGDYFGGTNNEEGKVCVNYISKMQNIRIDNTENTFIQFDFDNFIHGAVAQDLESTIYFFLGLLNYHKNKDDASFSYFNKSIELGDFSMSRFYIGLLYIKKKDYINAEKELKHSLTLFNELIDAKIVLASLEVEFDSLNIAKRLSFDVLHKNRNNPSIYNTLGIIYYKSMKFDSSLFFYNLAIRFDRKNGSYYYNRGLTFSELKRSYEAIRDYDLASKFGFREKGFYTTIGVEYTNIGLYKEALREHNKEIEEDSTYLSAYVNRGCTYNQMKKYKEALYDFNKVIAKDSSYDIALLERSKVYMHLNDTNQALNDLSQFLHYYPYNTDALITRSMIYNRRNQYENALDDINLFLKYDQTNYKAFLTRATILSKQRKCEVAISDYIKAISLCSTDTIIYLNLAQCYFRMREHEKASKIWIKAYELGSKNALVCLQIYKGHKKLYPLNLPQ